MNIFRRYALRSMGRNRARTIVTIIGMALSMALMTAVIEGAASALVYFRDITVDNDGSYHAIYRDVPSEEARSFLANDQITDSITFSEVGYASEKNYPYLRILSGQTENSLLKINLASGRYPLNSNEIILPQNASDLNGNYCELNQTITLDVGIPYRDGKRAILSNPYDYENKDRNELKDTTSRTYTITGFYTNLPMETSGGSNDTAFTTDDTGDGTVDSYFTVNNIRKIKAVAETAANPDHVVLHKELLRYYSPSLSGMSANASMIIYGFAAVLILLVLAGSISMIGNSFSISVAERMKEYGMLKSIGASRHQIRSSVLTESLLCSLCGIVPGMALGFGGLSIAIHLVSGKLAEAYSDTSARIHMVLSRPGLLIAVIICLLTALIAAWKPASRAMRTTPLDSIRQTNEIRIRPKQVRTGKLTWELFGLEGALTSKNFRRSRSRFRSIIFSLAMSVILFISASSLCDYMTKTIDMEIRQNPADVTVNVNSGPSFSENASTYTDDLFTEMKNAAGLTEGTWLFSEGVDDLTVPSALLTEEYCTYGTADNCRSKNVSVNSQELMFMDDDSFHQLLINNNVSDPAGYFDASHPKAVIYNTDSARVAGGRNADLTFLNSNAFPVTASVTAHQLIDGETYVSTCGDHNEYACYLKNDQSMDDIDDESKAHKIPLSEAAMPKQLFIGAAITHLNMPFTMPVLIYPASSYASLKSMGVISGSYYSGQFYFQADRHQEAARTMEQYVSDHSLHYTYVNDNAENMEVSRSIIFTIRVFSIAFILLISLIATANIFNTIATNMQVRKREFAMLRSIGMTSKGFRKMLIDECLTYGLRSLLISLPLSVLLTYIIYRILNMREEISFYIPVSAVLTAVITVFIVILLSMIYGQRKLSKENLVEALRSETA